MTKIVNQMTLCCALALGFSQHTEVLASKGKQGHGQIKPYALSLKALQDVNQITDLYLDVNVIISGYAPATSAKHIQLKSFDTDGELRWTKNLQDVPLTAGQAVSSTAVQFDDMGRYQPVQAQVQVQTGQSVDTEVLRASTQVLFRPDLTVDSIDAEETVIIGQPVVISSLIKELNGDLGATANIHLYISNDLIDTVDAASIDANGSASAVFTTSFEEPGIYTLTVVAADVNPGDYDTSNNSFSITIEAKEPEPSVTPGAPMWASLWYHHAEGAYSHNYWDWWYGEYNYSQNGKWESLFFYLDGNNHKFNFPIEKVTISLAADNSTPIEYELANVQASWTWSDGNGTQAYHSSYLGNRDYLYIWSVNYPAWNHNRAGARVQHYAGNYVYFSRYHDYWWGYQYTGHEVYGQLLSAKNVLQATFLIEDDGYSYGGSRNLDLQSWRDQYSWSYGYWYGWAWGYVDLVNHYGSWSGLITP
jgi:hypothetical protein